VGGAGTIGGWNFWRVWRWVQTSRGRLLSVMAADELEDVETGNEASEVGDECGGGDHWMP